MNRLVYLDNAATSFPKPRSVTEEVRRCIRYYCGNPGRSPHAAAREAENRIYECRERVSRFFGSERPEGVVFTMNATQAINLALKGILRRGDHVILSDMEHNAVYRPIRRLAADGTITYDLFQTVRNGRALDEGEILASIRRLMIPGRTKMLICAHVPNLCSAERPIAAIGGLCRKHGIIFLLDAAQSAGHLPIDVKSSHVDILCAPGHKGLFGIQGCGFMLVEGDILPSPLIEGGNGIDSLEWSMPSLLPERLEAGTLPTPAIVSLSEGIGFLSRLDMDAVHSAQQALFRRTRDMLLRSKELCAKVYLPECEGSVLLFNLEGIPSEEVGRRLAERGICVRSGYHCSALGHKALGTLDGGAVRVSFSPFNREHDIDALIDALYECTGKIRCR